MEEYQIEAQRKAEVLIEALPYIQRFNRKIIVVKYGGSAMSDEKLQKSVIADVTLLKLVGFKPIIVHGGGKEISSWVRKTGKEAQFIKGLRVTDEETMEIAEMVLGRVSKKLVTMAEELGVKACSISGKDGSLLHVKKKLLPDGTDIGFVGEVTSADPKILFDMLDNDYLPIVAPIGLDEHFETYNINADEAACAIAKAVGADKLVYLTDVEGLYRNFEDKTSFISRISVGEAEEMIRDGIVGGGMLPTGRKEAGMADTMKQMIEQAEQDLLHTYNRYPIVFDHGSGVYLYDVNGKKYLDFCAGIAVFALGYANQEYNDALKAQVDKILHTSNYFYNEPAIRAAHLLKQASGMDRVFFTNSGAEAVEGALKAAVKYAYEKDGRTDHGGTRGRQNMRGDSRTRAGRGRSAAGHRVVPAGRPEFL